MKLVEFLKEKSNDYSDIERLFLRETGEHLVGSNLNQKKESHKKTKATLYSVIIPHYEFDEYLNGLLISLGPG